MHLLSCENPSRVYNKYLDQYVWVPCGKCNICKNKRAYKYTQLLEREKSQHPFSFFVTLTYDDCHLPILSPAGFEFKNTLRKCDFVSSRLRDGICIPFFDIFPMDKYRDLFHFSDIRYFYDWIYSPFKGVPYASKTDAQLFLKRLNKYAHDKVTLKFKNFRYFLVSEYGSTTFRPHFHAIFYVDNPELADKFSDCISACWQFGRFDCKPVENKACAYVAQYINKSADLPYVYSSRGLSPFFLCSRNPFIGTFSECPEDDAKLVDIASPTTFGKRKDSDLQLTSVPLQQSYKNRLFPKCPCFGSLPDSLRVASYRFLSRFQARTLKEFCTEVYWYLASDIKTDFANWLRSKLTFSDSKDFITRFDRTFAWSIFDKKSFNFLRRMYYCCRKISRHACEYGISVSAYIRKILEFYQNFEKYLLKHQYELQEIYSVNNSESCALFYPEYLYQNGYTTKSFIDEFEIGIGLIELADAAFYAFKNKKTHFKNAYLDSLELKTSSKYLFNLIKNYLYGKKCNETIEAFSA